MKKKVGTHEDSQSTYAKEEQILGHVGQIFDKTNPPQDI